MSAPVGARGNGLLAVAWAPLGECDPRLADELLELLATVSIAAYATPSPGTRGGYLEIRLPTRPLDRVYVDAGRRAEAESLVRSRMASGEHPEPVAARDLGADDEAWASIVAGLTAQGPGARGDWPALEDLPVDDQADQPPAEQRPPAPAVRRVVPATGADDREQPRRADPFDGDDNHYEPPEVGPLPPVHPVTRAAWLAVLAGAIFLFAPALGIFTDTQVSAVLGALLVVGGVGTLVARLHDGPPSDGGDDGAVV